MSSHVAKAIVRYLASALDLVATSCFLFFQDIKLLLMNTQYPDVECLSVGEHHCSQQFGYDLYSHTAPLDLVYL